VYKFIYMSDNCCQFHIVNGLYLINLVEQIIIPNLTLANGKIFREIRNVKILFGNQCGATQ
jgi:hypothetical protein